MPCGFDLARARAEADHYASALRRVAPRAISAGRAFVVDASSHFSRPGPRVAEGVELLATLFHPAECRGAPLAGRAAGWAERGSAPEISAPVRVAWARGEDRRHA